MQANFLVKVSVICDVINTASVTVDHIHSKLGLDAGSLALCHEPAPGQFQLLQPVASSCRHTQAHLHEKLQKTRVEKSWNPQCFTDIGQVGYRT
jgi:hypothetical protein